MSAELLPILMAAAFVLGLGATFLLTRPPARFVAIAILSGSLVMLSLLYNVDPYSGPIQQLASEVSEHFRLVLAAIAGIITGAALLQRRRW